MKYVCPKWSKRLSSISRQPEVQCMEFFQKYLNTSSPTAVTSAWSLSERSSTVLARLGERSLSGVPTGKNTPNGVGSGDAGGHAKSTSLNISRSVTTEHLPQVALSAEHRLPRFLTNKLTSSSRVKKCATALTRRHYVPLKRRKPTDKWHGVVSQKNGVLKHTAVKSSKLARSQWCAGTPSHWKKTSVSKLQIQLQPVPAEKCSENYDVVKQSAYQVADRGPRQWPHDTKPNADAQGNFASTFAGYIGIIHCADTSWHWTHPQA